MLLDNKYYIIYYFIRYKIFRIDSFWHGWQENNCTNLVLLCSFVKGKLHDEKLFWLVSLIWPIIHHSRWEYCSIFLSLNMVRYIEVCTWRNKERQLRLSLISNTKLAEGTFRIALEQLIPPAGDKIPPRQNHPPTKSPFAKTHFNPTFFQWHLYITSINACKYYFILAKIKEFQAIYSFSHTWVFS